MSELSVEPQEVYIEDPLGVEQYQEDDLIVAFETVSIIYTGLITTPYRDYQKPQIQSALRDRVTELSGVVNYSAESVFLAIDHIAGGTYSTENEFLNVVKTVIDKILEWLSNIKTWIVNLVKRLFNVRNQNKAASKATDQTFKQAKKTYEREKREFPDRIKVTLPGQCYVAFHSTRHKPKAGYVYNTAGLEKAIKEISADMTNYLNKFEKDSDEYLTAVQQIVTEFKNEKLNVSNSALIRINKTRNLRSLYHDKFQVVGFGLIDKPVRNQTRYFQSKLGLTNLVDDYGWNAVDSFEVTIDTAKFEELNSLIERSSDDILARIIVLTDQLANSAAIKQLSELRKEQSKLVSFIDVNDGESASSSMVRQKEVLARLNLTYELVDQLVDSPMLTSRFYTRYIMLLSRLMSNIALGISQKKN